jgi:hypothetical protein
MGATAEVGEEIRKRIKYELNRTKQMLIFYRDVNRN